MGWFGVHREFRVTYVELRGKRYSLKEIIDATRNFSSRNEIGMGRFGKVYKADLGDQVVAVKKLSLEEKRMTDEIETELYVQEKILKHDNLVQLLGYCSKRNLHLLIYEYMENGSLQRALFDQDSKAQLGWPKRFNICLGIAKGLKYLHEDNPNCKIVYRNMKPSNVLLDGNLNAKLADFGLAKIFDEENPYELIREKGTIAYMAPEYLMRRIITDKVDVYGFGAVLLEIVSGQFSARYEENQETDFLLDRAFLLHARGRLLDLVDKNMDISEFDVRKQAVEVLNLAMKCVNPSFTLRPTMSEVVSELEKIWNINTHSG